MTALRVVVLEARRSAEMCRLVERHGGAPIPAPAIREVPLEAAPEAHELVERLRRGALDAVVFLTGVGARALARAVEPAVPLPELVALLGGVTVLARGPKPLAVLREWGVRVAAVAEEPSTWRELLVALEHACAPLGGRCVAVQEYGVPNEPLYAALAARGVDVLRVPVYRWEGPDDPGPLQAAIARIVEGSVDAVLFTSASQVSSLAREAGRVGLEGALRAALRGTVVGSVGPVCSEALAAHGIAVDLEPSHPRMGHLVREASERAAELLACKRGERPV